MTPSHTKPGARRDAGEKATAGAPGDPEAGAGVNKDSAPRPLGRTVAEWQGWAKEQGEAPYRGKQIFHWVHGRGVFDPMAMANLPRALRLRLIALADDDLAMHPRCAEEIPANADAALGDEQMVQGDPPVEGTPTTFGALMPAVTVRAAEATPDGTQKLALGLGDGRTVETVLIPQMQDRDPDDEGDTVGADGESGPPRSGRRVTQCVSSQVGCAMGCTFCASGVLGLARNMDAAEILAQLHAARPRLSEGEWVRNVVFMGMGEPLHNYAAVARAIHVMTDATGLGLSMRRVTVSTSGLVPQIERLGEDFDGRVQLAISLHAANDRLRGELMPVNRKYPLAELIAALRRYPMPRRRRITIEYTLIDGVNDARADADALVRLLRDVPVKVNLIPLNPVPDSALRPTPPERVDAFAGRLRDQHLSCFVRARRGDAISAACGQLVMHGLGRRRRGLPALPLVATGD